MPLPEIVIDTNVLVSGLMSNRGYAFRLLQLVGTGRFEINLSVPLLLEYEDVLHRESLKLSVSRAVIDAVLDFHSAVARHHAIFFLWRPFLRDAKDDLVLELAVKARCDYIITYNKRDFQGVQQQFGIQVIDPREFLTIIGEVK
jgi:putative PIN family toxin of toxin-antitoxin system